MIHFAQTFFKKIKLEVVLSFINNLMFKGSVCLALIFIDTILFFNSNILLTDDQLLSFKITINQWNSTVHLL